MSALRILVLEDHAFQRSVAVKTLNYLGHHDVRAAADGAQALSMLKDGGAADLVLCDLRMKGMDGLEFLRLAGQAGLICSVIICSELALDLRRGVQEMVTLLGLEMLGDIGKPLRLELLQPLLAKCVRLSSEEGASTMRVPDIPTETEVRQGLARNEFRAYYQPKFHLHSGVVEGAEVLVRWVRPELSIQLPATFLPVIARCGLWNELFYGLLEQGLTLQRLFQDFGLPLELAFNLDVSQLASHDLCARIQASLHLHRLPASRLVFELTECGLLETSVVALETLIRLRMMGCGLAIDDFGTGFSSQQRLCQLPFNEIKLDAEFVQGMLYKPRCQAVIDSTLALAKALNIRVVAEGIESIEQCRRLAQMGCTQGQGYLYARPMSGAELVAWFFEKNEWHRRSS
ncbi:EAL domain-containing response regulator [Pseudomonas sp. 22526]|uniref:EAL domain-containing response regulator n=1 Tax=Pseudomonas sp. 22526 TaxID=3453937 RepID=UPI003F853205